VQEAANMRQLRDIGIDPDICATVAHARIGTEKNFGAGPVGVSSGESVRNEVLANTFAMYGGAMTATERKELSSHLLKQADAADPTSGVFENALLKARAQATAAGANFAYWNGADPKKGPEVFTDLFTAQTNRVTGFKHDKTNILGQFNQATLFNPNPFGVANTTEGYGLFLKNSLQSAIQDSLGQPAVLANPRLRTNLMKLFSSLDDETKAATFFKELGNAGAGGFRDMSGAVKAGISNLGAEFASHGNVVGAARMASAAGTVGATDGEMKLGDWLSYMSYRNDANGFFGSSGIAMSMLVFGDAGATKAFIDGVGALNFSNLLKPNTGSVKPMFNGSYFMNYLAEKDPGFQLFTGAESKQFSRYYFGYTNARGESEDKKRLLGWKQLGWTIGPNASGMQKMAYKFHTYHPYSFVTGLLTGETPQRMIEIGTDHRRFLTQPDKWSKGAKWAGRLMKNKSYQTVMRISAKVQAIMAIPGRIVRDATQKVAKIVLEKVIMKVAVKLGLQAVVLATATLLTAGMTEAIYWIYVVLNWLSGGFLEKVVKGAVKLTFEFVVSVVLWIVVTLIMVGVIIIVLIGLIPMSGLGFGGMLHPPDVGYVPIVSTDTSGGNIQPPGTYLFPGDCEAYKGLTCPFTFTSGVYCSQGPRADYTHSCAPDALPVPGQNRYAVDISGPTDLIAPEDGNIIFIEPNETCGGDPNGAYLMYKGSETGTVYVFAHLELQGKAASGGSGSVSIPVTEGEKLGRAAPLSSYCSAKGGCACWHHQHIHAYVQGTTQSDIVYGIMCGGKTVECSRNCTPDCATCGAGIVPDASVVCDGSNGQPPVEKPGDDGIDVSHHQENIDWNKVKQSGYVDFAIIKATEGNGYQDDKFAYNWKESKRVGIKRSAYHFFKSQYDGVSQADYFIDFVTKYGDLGDFEFTVDVEPVDGDTIDQAKSTANLKKFVDRVESRLGYKLIIYTNTNAWTAMTTSPAWAGNHPLWVAAYTSGSKPPDYAIPPAWNGKWLLWQYSSTGTIPGISKPVDLDVWTE